MQELSNSDLIYLDPDNGAAGAAVKPYSRRSVKYAFADEISAWLRCGQTVILYQHQQRKPLRMQVEEQLANFARWGSSGWALSFHRNSTRLYFVLPAIEDHRVLLLERSKAFLATRWGTNDHFSLHKRMDQSA